MAELPPLARASPAPSRHSGQPVLLPADVEEPVPTPLAWLEIESLTFGEFIQVVRVPFFCGQVIRIGRDSGRCNLRFKNKSVSPVHCEIYSVLFDKDEPYPPLIYVRDCQSASGTYVNGQLVEVQAFAPSPARLLENNDTISVGPCSVRLREYLTPNMEWALSSLQRTEAALFADQFVIKDTILGTGGFGKVYLALNVATSQQVICKVHDFSHLSRCCKSIAARVDRETLIWSQLEHPNIVAFHRAYRTNNTMFTFGDLATGGDLFSLLERERSISELELKWIAIQVLRAVDYLHCKGVAHRDIKPENILCLSSTHTWHRILLADFGCAKLTGLGEMPSHADSNGYRTPYVFMHNVKRETHASKEPHGVALDIWSIGALVLQLLSGTDPVDLSEASCTDVGIADLAASVNRRRAGHDSGPISQNGIDFILACLNPQPFARPSAAEAAKHPWLRESAEQAMLFKERDKQLAWRPRGIVIPAVVRLPDSLPASVRSSEDTEEHHPIKGTASHTDDTIGTDQVRDPAQPAKISNGGFQQSDGHAGRHRDANTSTEMPNFIIGHRRNSIC